MHERELDPLELGIPRCDPSELSGGSPEENARRCELILAGADGGRRDAVLLNAAGAIAAAGHAEDLARGPRARARGGRLGRGGDRLEELARFSRAV